MAAEPPEPLSVRLAPLSPRISVIVQLFSPGEFGFAIRDSGFGIGFGIRDWIRDSGLDSRFGTRDRDSGFVIRGSAIRDEGFDGAARRHERQLPARSEKARVLSTSGVESACSDRTHISPRFSPRPVTSIAAPASEVRM